MHFQHFSLMTFPGAIPEQELQIDFCADGAALCALCINVDTQ